MYTMTKYDKYQKRELFYDIRKKMKSFGQQTRNINEFEFCEVNQKNKKDSSLKNC